MHDRLRRQQQHAEGGHRQRAKRQRRPVGHDADQHDRGHDEGALGRDLGAGQQEIAEGRDQRADRGPFLDRAGAGEAGDQRKQRAQHEEHHARHHGHVIAGDRQHVREARDVHGVVDRRRDRVALAGDQRRRDGALVAGQARRGCARRCRRAGPGSTAAYRSHRPGGDGASAGLIAPSTKPVAPMPWK